MGAGVERLYGEDVAGEDAVVRSAGLRYGGSLAFGAGRGASGAGDYH